MSVVFFFGASAEVFYNLPLGAEYTQRTMCYKNDVMLEELRTFYSNVNKDFNYIKEFMFNTGRSKNKRTASVRQRISP